MGKKRSIFGIGGGPGSVALDWFDRMQQQAADKEAASIAKPADSYGVNDATEEQIFANALRRARSLAPTGGALAQVVNQRVGETGNSLLERFNQRGQGVGSGLFADALARTAGRESTEAELGNQERIGSLTMGMFNPRLANEFDTQKTMYTQGWDNYNNSLARADALKREREARKSQRMNRLLSMGGAVAGGLLGGSGGGSGVASGGGLPGGDSGFGGWSSYGG